jgi:hypothetical protein
MDASKEQCSVCKRPVSFSHPDTNIIQCSCGNVNMRDEFGTISSKAFRILLDPTDPIQPGTTGLWYGGTSFKVLGRIRAWFENSVFNYWTVLFEDGTLRWLGEGYGQYFLMEKLDTNPLDLGKAGSLHVNVFQTELLTSWNARITAPNGK